MAGLEENLFDSKEAMVAALRDDVVARLSVAADQDGRASLVGSGGSTPGPLFDALSRSEAPWEKVEVTTTDERWASADDDASNEKLIRTRLITNKAAGARYVSLLTGHDSPLDPAAEAEANARIAAMRRPFDVVIAGMGPDGHAVSWFPGLPGTDPSVIDPKAPALARGVGPIPTANGAPNRMTLTLHAIGDARRLVLLFTGEEKMAVFRKALEPGPTEDLPVRALLRDAKSPVALYWAP
ncbi:MAG: 6-phosphogluconolactonase [Caulobacteraceae bacterium]|nr:6-phosphogluconolactonase [Caulobacter sp.]